MDSKIDEIAKLLSDVEAQIRAAAVTSLKAMSKADQYAEKVVPLIADSDVQVRIAAAELLGGLGGKAAGHVPALGKLLSATHCGVTAAAATALAGIGADAASEVGALAALLDDSREDTSSRMFVAAGIAPRAPAGLRKPACAAADALAAIGSAAVPAAERLAECLKSEDAELREKALVALGSLGKEGASFERKVLERLGDPSPAVVAAACIALGTFAMARGPSAAVAEEVADLLNSKQPQARAAACESLAMMGDESEPYLETFVRLFNDRAACVQAAAIKAAAKCGEMGQMYATQISRMMYEGYPTSRAAAIEAMALMGERGRSFYEEIEELRNDPEVGYAAMATLERLSAEGPEQVADEPHSPIELGYDVAPAGPPLPVALLFPGQGSQYVKMLENVKDLPMVKAMTDRAKSLLGFDILNICLKGPEDRLQQTKICQPAMYIGGLAALEELKRTKPDVVARKKAVAGFSLGEYTALAAAGVFDFETGLKLVQLRGEAMQEAAEASPQMMVSVAGLERRTVERLCEESKTSGTDICQVANSLFPNGFTCAGSREAVMQLQEKALKEPDCLQAKAVKTSGAFHTGFMMPAKKKLLRALVEAEPKMKSPKCEVYMNVTGKKILPGTSPAEIIDMLSVQMTSCVEWHTSMQGMIDDNITEFYECGPMKQLKAMMKRINPKAGESMTSVMV